MPVLTAIDVLGVQRFVFSSNRLRDVVTGSFLVQWCTSSKGALAELVSSDNILLAGGGNAIVEFGSKEKARSFTAEYTRLLHDEAPGLDVAVVHKNYDEGNLGRALQEIQIELARAKIERLPSVPFLGLSVTASCAETGLPASGFDKNDLTIPLSKEISGRREKVEVAQEHWFEFLKGFNDYAFPMELDHLGRTIGDTSLIGVVHVDGNGVGEKIKDWLKSKSENGVGKDDNIRGEYKEWSQAIDELGRQVLRALVDRLCQRLVNKVENGAESMRVTGNPAHLGFELKKVDGQWMLPLRPILLGGDDLTFVCDGRIALDLAETALKVFEKGSIPHLGNITACAGVAMARVHAPFARAYELAEKLCASAKRMLKEENNNGCALDWHIGACRPGETVASIRKRQYRTNDYQLTCRPYRLGSGKNETETWRWLSGTLLDDNNTGLRRGVWSRRRNKVEALARLVRDGPVHVQAAMEAWQVVDKNLKLPNFIEENGFFEKRTPLLDALELLDLHLVLEPAGNDQG